MRSTGTVLLLGMFIFASPSLETGHASPLGDLGLRPSPSSSAGPIPQIAQIAQISRQIARIALSRSTTAFAGTTMTQTIGRYPGLRAAIIGGEEATVAFLSGQSATFYDDIALAAWQTNPVAVTRFLNTTYPGGYGSALSALNHGTARVEVSSAGQQVLQRAIQRLEAEGIGPGHPELQGRLESALLAEAGVFTSAPTAGTTWAYGINGNRFFLEGTRGSLSINAEVSFAQVIGAAASAAALSGLGTRVAWSIAAEDEESSGLAVAEMVVTSGIDNLTPLDDLGDQIHTHIGEVTVWTQITGPASLVTDPEMIEHVWYFSGDVVQSILLPVQSPRWRTWSTKSIPPIPGAWRVEIRDHLGTVLSEKTFFVVPGGG